MGFPALSTERLVLRPLRPADVEACFALYADPEVTRYLGWTCPDRAAYGELFETALARHAALPAGEGVWGAEERETGLLCGIFILKGLEGRPEIEIGYHLARNAWGRGLATEGSRELLRYAFADLGLDRVICLVDPANARSAAVAGRLGLEPMGEDEVDGQRCLRFDAVRPE